MYNPICTYRVAQRNVSPGECKRAISPIVFWGEMLEKTPFGGCGWFDVCCNPVESAEEAEFVVYPDVLAPPPGFHTVFPPAVENTHSWEQAVQNYTEAVHCLPEPSVAPKAPVIVCQEFDRGQLEEDDGPSLVETRNGYVIFSASSGQRMKATNYLVDVSAVVSVFKAVEKEPLQFVKIWVNVLGAARTAVALQVPYEEIDAVTTLIGKKIGTAIIYPGARKVVPLKIAVMLREKLAFCNQEAVYEMTGWVRTPYNELVYVHDGAAPPRKEVRFASGFSFGIGRNLYAPWKLVESGWNILSLSQNKTATLVPYLFAHLGLMWSLFDQAGYPPHVLLFLRGKTGSLKTAFASFLFNFEARKESAIPATFRDTSASMEVRMGKYKDRVLLVDDFCPAASENAKRILEQNLEQLIRFYGDGIAKGRTNPRLSEVYENRPHGLCAITGEDSAGSYSSLLRCLFIDVDQATYDKVKLSTYQKNPGLWTGYLELFVEYCVANAGSIVSLVQEAFPALREKGRQHLSEARLVDAFCSLSLTVAIVLNFVKEYLKFTEQQVTELNSEFSALCLACCVRSAEEAKSADPVKIFVRAVHEGLAQQAILLGDKAEFIASPNKFIGCADSPYEQDFGDALDGYVKVADTIDVEYFFDVMAFYSAVQDMDESTFLAMKKVFENSTNPQIRTAMENAISNRFGGGSWMVKDVYGGGIGNISINLINDKLEDYLAGGWKPGIGLGKIAFEKLLHPGAISEAVIYMSVGTSIQKDIEKYYWAHRNDKSEHITYDLRAIAIMHIKTAMVAYDYLSFDKDLAGTLAVATKTFQSKLDRIFSYSESEYAPDYDNQELIDYIDTLGVDTDPSDAPTPSEDPRPSDTPASGTCGDNLTWKYEDGTLTISGTGKMYDYAYGDAPWDEFYKQIKTVVITDGVTSIGKASLSGFNEMTSVTIPTSLTSIERSAFFTCQQLRYVYYAGSEEEWGQIAIAESNFALEDALFFFNGATPETVDTGRKVARTEREDIDYFTAWGWGHIVEEYDEEDRRISKTYYNWGTNSSERYMRERTEYDEAGNKVRFIYFNPYDDEHEGYLLVYEYFADGGMREIWYSPGDVVKSAEAVTEIMRDVQSEDWYTADDVIIEEIWYNADGEVIDSVE